MKILVVDDELDEVESLSRGLRSKGYQVLAALSAQEALNHIHDNEGTIDLVLTDYSMPVRNGIDLLSDIRRKDNSVPIMMMTAYAQKDLVIKALRQRCDGFIEKPFSLDELLVELERTQSKAIQNAGSHQPPTQLPLLIHQINNPLTCISGSAEIAMNKLDDAEALEKCIRRIIASVNTITGINMEILNTGHPSRQKMGKVNIKAVIDDCLATIEDLLVLKDISVENLYAPTALHVWGHRFDLEQLFKNLLANAIDAVVGRPQRLIRIKANMDPDRASITISIEDTGCGIPELLLDKIYTPYYTLKEGGTGLGLTVVKKIIDAHGGKIEVQSVSGQGTTFVISLPQFITGE